MSGDCTPFLRTLTALYNGITGHEEENPAMSRSLDFLLIISGMRDSLADWDLPEFARVDQLMDSSVLTLLLTSLSID